MAEEGLATETEEAPTDPFTDSMGADLGETDTPESAEPEPDKTPDFDWSTVNLETVDINEVPENLRPAAEAAQRRIREMRSGVDKKINEVRDYEKELSALKEEITALKNPDQQSYEPGRYDVVAKQLGYDLESASPAARESFNVVNNIIENHPVLKELQTALTSIKEQLGPATEFVQRQQDSTYDAEIAEATKNHGEAIVQTVIDKFGDLRGREGLDGKPLTVDGLVRQMSGLAMQQSRDADAKAKAAKNGARSVAGGLNTVTDLSDDGPDDDVDAFFIKHFGN